MRVSLTFRGDYAVRAMLALAAHEAPSNQAEKPSLLSAGAIAAAMRIPPRFVAHVLADLVRAGLVVGSAGRRSSIAAAGSGGAAALGHMVA